MRQKLAKKIIRERKKWMEERNGWKKKMDERKNCH